MPTFVDSNGRSSVHPYSDGVEVFQAIHDLVEYTAPDEKKDFLQA